MQVGGGHSPGARQCGPRRTRGGASRGGAWGRAALSPGRVDLHRGAEGDPATGNPTPPHLA
eukprot:8247369-Pyramimonas_sp.AAC.1